MNFLYLSASNIAGVSSEQSTSYRICQIARRAAQRRYPDARHTIVELRTRRLSPCVGCGACWATHRCAMGDDFNDLYTRIIDSDLLLIVSPHYAPIPAKLAALLEKMEQITFLRWGADSAYRSEVFGKPTGVISHGGGSDCASYKRMVNDPIANALDTIQLRLIPLSEAWNTGLALPVARARHDPGAVFPEQQYDWEALAGRIADYMEQLLLAL